MKVLDYGSVDLVDHVGNDLAVSRNARVSYETKGREKDEGLINYLISNGHWSPLEACYVTFEVKAPIFIARQWMRHQQKFNEVSGRYKELPEEYYVPSLDQITTQSTDNKQMRTNTQNPNAETIEAIINDTNHNAFKNYHRLIELGTPRELARSVLPLSTYTHFFASTTLRNWIHFLQQRLHRHAQYEIQVYAKAIENELEQLFPLVMKAFRKTYE